MINAQMKIQSTEFLFKHSDDRSVEAKLREKIEV